MNTYDENVSLSELFNLELETYSDMDISKLPLSMRVINRLHCQDIYTLGELLKINRAFKISEKNAGDEGYDKEQVTGFLSSTDEYPGCPYCGEMGFVLCTCGKFGCSHIEGGIYKCPWCGNTGRVSSADSFDISGSGY